MAASFPTSVKSFTAKVDGAGGDLVAAADVNGLQDEVIAIETELKKTTGSVVDHGGLAGLADNDHPQYSLTTHDHDSDYLGITTTGVWQAWTPTKYMLASISSSVFRYCTIGKLVFFAIYIYEALTSDVTFQFGITLPVPAASGINQRMLLYITVNGTLTSAFYMVPSSSIGNAITFHLPGDANWTASANINLAISGFYEAAA